MGRKLVLVVAVVVAGWLFWWSPLEPPPPVSPGAAGTLPSLPAGVPRESTATVVPPGIDRVVAADPAAVGALRVRLLAALGDERWPVDGMLVELWPGPGARPPFAGAAPSLLCRSDARGEIVLPAVAAGTWHARVPADPDGHPVAAEVEAGGEALLELSFAARRVVRGLVVDAAGTPVAGAQIWVERGVWTDAYRVPESDELTARCAGCSDAAGCFVVPVVDRERVIAASHPAYAASRGRVVGSTDIGELRLVLGPAPASLAVDVRGADGAPLAGALVVLECLTGGSMRRSADGALLAPRPPRLAHTDTGGRAVFTGLVAGRHRVCATAWPQVPATEEVDVAPDASPAVELRLEEGVAVVGHVRDTNGEPVRALVSSRPFVEPNGRCITREDGSFVLRCLPRRTMWIVATTLARGGPIVARHQIVEPPGGTIACDLVVDPVLAGPTDRDEPANASVRGRLLAADGMPLVGRLLHLAPAAGGEARSQDTAADGTFAWDALPAGSWQLAYWRGGTWIDLRPVPLAAARALDLGDVVLPPEATMRVELVHADGTPWRSEPPGIDLVRADGTEAVVQLRLLPGALLATSDPGTYAVRVRATDLTTDAVSVTLSEGVEANLRLPLRLGRTFELRFFGDDEFAGATRVVVRDAAGHVVLQPEMRWQRRAGSSSPEGRARATLPFGRYEVEASDDAGTSHRGRFELSTDLEASTDFVVPRAR